MTESGSSERSRADLTNWKKDKELGTPLGMRAILIALRIMGRGPVRLILRFVVFYYVLFYARVRAYSRDYLRRVGASTSFWSVWRHVCTFAFCALDRFFFVRGETERFKVDRSAVQPLWDYHQAGGAGILLGAHFGSFEAMRAKARDDDARVSVVMDNQHAKMVRQFLDAANADDRLTILEVGDGAIDLVLKARDCVEQGRLVVILADRVAEGQRYLEADFLGSKARFPLGPFLMASKMNCPVYTIFGVYEGDNRYRIMCNKFSERLEFPRSRRQEAMQEAVQNFAAALEKQCREHPYCWFNFFDYWQSKHHD